MSPTPKNDISCRLKALQQGQVNRTSIRDADLNKSYQMDTIWHTSSMSSVGSRSSSVRIPFSTKTCS